MNNHSNITTSFSPHRACLGGIRLLHTNDENRIHRCRSAKAGKPPRQARWGLSDRITRIRPLRMRSTNGRLQCLSQVARNTTRGTATELLPFAGDRAVRERSRRHHRGARSAASLFEAEVRRPARRTGGTVARRIAEGSTLSAQPADESKLRFDAARAGSHGQHQSASGSTRYHSPKSPEA